MSLDLFWLRDDSLEDSANLPDPHLLAQEIADDLRSALAQIEDVLGGSGAAGGCGGGRGGVRAGWCLNFGESHLAEGGGRVMLVRATNAQVGAEREPGSRELAWVGCASRILRADTRAGLQAAGRCRSVGWKSSRSVKEDRSADATEEGQSGGTGKSTSPRTYSSGWRIVGSLRSTSVVCLSSPQGGDGTGFRDVGSSTPGSVEGTG